MTVEQIYTGCLAQGAYYIRSKGEAVIIDPLREVSPYIERAKKDGVEIKYVFETHFHADFVSGHLSLAEKTGATIIYGPEADPKFDAYIAKDGEKFQVGDVTLTVLHTPGHTIEGSTFLLRDENGKDVAIFTGDTLFLGDVGRPDLAQKDSGYTEGQLAGMLFDSLRNKIMPLADDLMVYPAHGAGSACGKRMMKETKDTLGNQKKVNYALRADMTKEQFIAEVTDGLGAPPAYFPMNVQLNREGYSDIDKVLGAGTQALSTDEFMHIAETDDVLILDVRKSAEYAACHIPNSIFIGLDGSFAPWVGELLVDVKQRILLIAPAGREEEAVTRLARVGFDHCLGYLSGGMEAWKASGRETGEIKSISAEAFAQEHKDAFVIDVRKPTEYQSQHLLEARNLPLQTLRSNISQLPEEGDIAVHCAGGYRSMIAASIMKANAVHNLINIEGGFGAISETNLKTTEFVCPTTL